MSGREPYPCPRTPSCGHLHAGCIAHNRRGLPCGNHPMKITGNDRPRCKNHLGQSVATVQAQHDVGEVLRIRAEQTQATAERLGMSIDDAAGVLDALLVNFRNAVAWGQVCEAMLAELKETRYRNGNGEQTRSEVLFFERSLDRVSKIGADLIRLGIETRLAKITETQQTAIVDAIEGGLAELAPQIGLDLTAAGVRTVIGRHLAAVTA